MKERKERREKRRGRGVKERKERREKRRGRGVKERKERREKRRGRGVKERREERKERRGEGEERKERGKLFLLIHFWILDPVSFVSEGTHFLSTFLCVCVRVDLGRGSGRFHDAQHHA